MVFSGWDAMWLIKYAEEMDIRNLNLATCANGLKLEDLTFQSQKLAEKCNFEQPEGMRWIIWPLDPKCPLFGIITSFECFWHLFLENKMDKARAHYWESKLRLDSQYWTISLKLSEHFLIIFIEQMTKIEFQEVVCPLDEIRYRFQSLNFFSFCLTDSKI